MRVRAGGWAAWTLASTVAGLAVVPAVRGQAIGADAFYVALVGEPEPVAADLLLGAPGRFVGHAVRTTGQLRTRDAGAALFDLAVGNRRLRLQLEPEARGGLAGAGAAWEGKAVEVDSLFYRDAGGPAGGEYALRAWRVGLPGAAARDEKARRDGPAPGEPEVVTLEQLVYGAGRYDGRTVRVRGSFRGSNRHRDLPEASRRSREDWVIKDGYFAAWVTGDVPGERDRADAEGAVEVLGVPTTAGGVVRIAARRVDPVGDADAGEALPTPRNAGAFAMSPSVTFAYPVPGELLRPGGRMILQFSKALDPRSLESRIRVRYQRDGVETAAPRVLHQYRGRNRALLLIPDPAPPPRTDVVVELLEGIIDVDGRGLAPFPEARDAEGSALPAGVVARARFRSTP